MKSRWVYIALWTSLLGMAAMTFAQQQKEEPMKDFAQEWQQVEAFSRQGQPRSALEVVEKIYQAAKAENNSAQMVKALLRQMQFQAAYQEDALRESIQRIESEIAGSRYPVKPLLQSVLAEMYWGYYQQNRYQILDRTTLSGVAEEDLSVWDAQKFVRKCIELYRASLEPADRLKQTPVDIYDPVLNKQPDSRKFRPTLYDLLAHRAVDFFRNDEPGITRPAEQFRLDSREAFAPAPQFSDARFRTPDSLAFKYYALIILQDLLAFHLQDDDPAALVDVDLKRLEFARANAIHPEKDDLYREALENLEKTYRNFPISTWVSYEIARFYYQRSSQYRPGEDHLPQNETYQGDRRRAYELCQAAIKRFPQSEGAQNCRALQTQITHTSLSLAVEKINLPQQPFRALVKYQNVSQLYLRLVTVTPETRRREEETRRNDTDKWLQFYRQQPAAAEWQVALPEVGDYHEHAVEIKLSALDLGFYAVLIGTSPDFSRQGEAAALGETWISRLGLLQKSTEKRESGFYVFDRHQGQPLAGVEAQLWLMEYDQKLRKNLEKSGPTLLTDQNGFFQVDASTLNSRNNNFKVDLRHKQDRLFLDQFYNLYRSYPRPEKTRTQTRTFFFTDRSIYRPGQTIYFKGLMVESQGEENRVLANHSTRVVFYDVNRQKIAEQTLVSSDYGSFSGSFTAPTGGLTGAMALENESGRVSVSVEEYKRPRFEVTFEALKGSFRLNDTVPVRGTARAYAGASIDSAPVQYRVVRQTMLPYVWNAWRWPGIYFADVEIANGRTQTDAGGNFTIDFPALPDPTISKEHQPIFQYTVYADVTDISGETRSARTTVQVGYVALSIDLDLPESIQSENPSPVAITSQNLNGEFEAASGTIVVHRLQGPGRILRERLWDAPDQFILSKADYVAAFPHDVYQHEDDYRNWKKGEEVLTQRFDTGQSDTLTLEGLSSWPQGKYRLELQTRDAFGEAITLVKFFTLYGLEDKSVPHQALSWYAPEKTRGEPGDLARVYWGSAAEDIHAHLEIYRRGEMAESRWIRTGKTKNGLIIPILEKDRGNFSFFLFYVKFGRVHTLSHLIEVPWSNKQLTITYETFRDKLRPGQVEEWRLKIAGPEGEKVAAEMLASMYDASLDAFLPHSWYFDIYPTISAPQQGFFYFRPAFSFENFVVNGKNWNPRVNFLYRSYDRLNWSVPYGGGVRMLQRSAESQMSVQRAAPMAAAEGQFDEEAAPEMKTTADLAGETPALRPSEAAFEEVSVRTNLNETAFFYPDLKTNAEGEIILAFTMPEALTRWKFLGLAHSEELQYALTEKTVVTQKELMVTPNAPRFLREGDRLTFTGKVANLSEDTLSGSAVLQLFDAVTMKPVDETLGNSGEPLPFTVSPKESAGLQWDLAIPRGFLSAVTYRIIAKTERFSDGEENTLPVLPNRMLVTESLPLPIRGRQSKQFTFDKLLRADASSTLQHQQLTLEFTPNPAWYAVQALPYLMEFPYDCSEQIFSRYYANSLATHIANANPKIKRVFERWREEDREALLSNLEKNQELKNVLLEETPWVLQAQDESERKKRLALLFDLNKMRDEGQRALQKLQQMQAPSGAWPWFPGMEDNRHITAHIVSGLGHLERLGVMVLREQEAVWAMLQRSLVYLDEEMAKDYQRLLEQERSLEEQTIGSIQIQYLYARSFFPEVTVAQSQQTAFDYWKSQASQYWLSHNKYLQGMIALALHRLDESGTPAQIIRSLREHALVSEEMGMYWKENQGGYYWYQAPVETQALMIELFEEVASDSQAVADLKVWLLKQKQTQNWPSTKATAEACYALLLRGGDWLAAEPQVQITVGKQTIDPQQSGMDAQAGSGYFKTSWSGAEIRPEMGRVTVTKQDPGVAWGALYWQYFEDLDQITPHETPLKLEKQLFRQENTPTGPVLKVIEKASDLQPGDLVKVRIELRVDRDLEYVHMKDLRAAGFEPLNVLSQYHYQGGLGYYQSTRDASTNFFFSRLPRGTFVFEYPLRVTHSGDFSNGVTTIQCMYAPEFSAHSEGIRVQVFKR